MTQTQAILAAGLELLGAGPYNLGGLVNTVPVIAANTTEAIAFRTGGALTVDTVNTIGITTTNDNIELCADAGPLTLAQNISIGTGTLRIDSGNGISQTGGTITAGALGAVTTAGDITLSAGRTPCRSLRSTAPATSPTTPLARSSSAS